MYMTKERNIFMTTPSDTNGDEQENPTLWEIAVEHNVSYADAVPIQEDMRLKRDALKIELHWS